MEPSTDWKVQIAHVAADVVIVIVVACLMAARVLGSELGIAILGPLVGARLSVAGIGKRGAAAPAGGAVALLGIVAAAGLALARSRAGVAVLTLAGLALASSIAACGTTRAQRAGVIELAGGQCVLVTDPAGRAACVLADEIAAVLNQIVAARASSPSEVQTAKRDAVVRPVSSAAAAAGSR